MIFWQKKSFDFNHDLNQWLKSVRFKSANPANYTVLRAVLLTQYRRVTDRQTDGNAIASTALAMRALRRAVKTRHRARTSMYSLTFCVRVMLPERHQWKPGVKAAAVMLRTTPSPASHRPAARADPAERSHYVVISRDGRKLVTRVRVMLP